MDFAQIEGDMTQLEKQEVYRGRQCWVIDMDLEKFSDINFGTIYGCLDEEIN